MNDSTHNEYGDRIAQPDQPPGQIWLQWYGDGDGHWSETDYGADVTWSRDKNFDGDICYVRAGKRTAEMLEQLNANYALATARAQAAEARVAELEAALDDAQRLADERGERILRIEGQIEAEQRDAIAHKNAIAQVSEQVGIPFFVLGHTKDVVNAVAALKKRVTELEAQVDEEGGRLFERVFRLEAENEALRATPKGDEWTPVTEPAQDGELYIATVPVEYYADRGWVSADDGETNLSNFIRMYQLHPYAPQEAIE